MVATVIGTMMAVMREKHLQDEAWRKRYEEVGPEERLKMDAEKLANQARHREWQEWERSRPEPKCDCDSGGSFWKGFMWGSIF